MGMGRDIRATEKVLASTHRARESGGAHGASTLREVRRSRCTSSA